VSAVQQNLAKLPVHPPGRVTSAYLPQAVSPGNGTGFQPKSKRNDIFNHADILNPADRYDRSTLWRVDPKRFAGDGWRGLELEELRSDEQAQEGSTSSIVLQHLRCYDAVPCVIQDRVITYRAMQYVCNTSYCPAMYTTLPYLHRVIRYAMMN